MLVLCLNDDGLRYEKFTLKVISKQQQLEQCQLNLQEQRKVGQMIEYPGIRKLYRSFKDETNIYFLLEYIQGMELFDVIRDLGTFTLPDTR